MPRKKKEIVKKYQEPIIEPQKENFWEAWQTFNPGVILLENKVHFLYRAIGYDGISRLGYASSEDGFELDERLEEPVFEHKNLDNQFKFYSYFSGGSLGGVEDPRLTLIEDTIYMLYVGFDFWLPQLHLTSIKKDDFLNKNWNFKNPINISPPGIVTKSGVLFPEKINDKYLILYRIFPDIWGEFLYDLEFKDKKYLQGSVWFKIRKSYWDSKKIGAGAPPIKTKYGWLLVYYGVDEKDPGKYQIGVMILEIENPKKVIVRTEKPIITPTEWFELNGHKSGVCYPTGCVVKDGKILIYYGAADSYVAVAFTDFDYFLEEIIRDKKVYFEKKFVKKKTKK
jgi:predicted GH43/DUF377 family glycosyl hydrolase